MTGSPLPSFEQFCAKQTSSPNSDDLTEQAIAMKGDWEAGVNSLGSQSEFGMKKFTKLGVITTSDLPRLDKPLEIYQLRNSLLFKVGYWSVDTKKPN